MAYVAGTKTTAHDTALVSEAWKDKLSFVVPHKHPAEVIARKVGKKGSIRQKTYHFGTRKPLPDTDTTAEAHTAAGTGLKMDNIASWRTGEAFKPLDGGANVECYVTAVGTTYVTFAVVSGTDRNFADGITVQRLGAWGEEASAYRSSAFEEAAEYTNTLGELEDSWALSDIKSREQLFVKEEEIPNLVRTKLYEHVNAKEIAFFRAEALEGATSGPGSRRVGIPGGVGEFIDTYGTTAESPIYNKWEGADVDFDQWDEFLRHMSMQCSGDGTNKFIFCAGKWPQFFKAVVLKYGTQYLTPGKTEFGFPMKKWHGDYGVDFHIVYDPALDPRIAGGGSDLFCIDMDAVETIYFDGVDGICDAREYNTTQTDDKKQSGVLYSFFTWGWGAPEFHGQWLGMTGFSV